MGEWLRQRQPAQLLRLHPEQFDDPCEEERLLPPAMAKTERSLPVLFDPHAGQVGFLFSETLRKNSSKARPHFLHSNSYIGIAIPHAMRAGYGKYLMGFTGCFP